MKQLLQDPAHPPHPQFRLWLVTRPSQAFPASLLRSGTYLFWEMQRGLRASMLQPLPALQEAHLSCPAAAQPGLEQRLPQLCFGLLLFHAVAQVLPPERPLAACVRLIPCQHGQLYS